MAPDTLIRGRAEDEEASSTFPLTRENSVAYVPPTSVLSPSLPSHPLPLPSPSIGSSPAASPPSSSAGSSEAPGSPSSSPPAPVSSLSSPTLAPPSRSSVSSSKASPSALSRHVGPYASTSHRVRYFVVLGALIIAAIGVTIALLTWGNDFEILSDKWWRVSRMRITAVVVITLVTFCQTFATVTFQTVTNNRIITPSIMGFESLFVLVQTSIVYFLGVNGLITIGKTGRFFLQVALMVAFAVVLYLWLLSGRFGSLHIMLLVGIVIGTGLGALSAFMQRMLDPNEFDVLRARLFANIGNADADLLPFVIPACGALGIAIWLLARRLNVLSLGPEIAINLGVDRKRQMMVMLTLVSILMALTTSLVGPMTFLGFLVATLAYSLTDTYDHRRILPVAWLAGFVILGGAYFLLKHVFTMVDAVGIIVELIGGMVFLVVIFKRGRL